MRGYWAYSLVLAAHLGTTAFARPSATKGSRNSCVVTPFAAFNGTEINVIPGAVGGSLVGNENGCKEHCYDNADCTWWTWYNSDSSCHLYSKISNANVSCSYECLTGERGCYSNETCSAAVIGGLTPIDNPVEDVEVIEESGGASQDDLVPDLPQESSRSLLASATVELKMFACGGILTDGTVTDTCLTYDLAQPCSNWNQDLTMSGPRSNAAATGAYGSLYIFGGTDGKQVLNSVDILEPETMTWSSAPPMPTPRSDHCVARHRDEVYVVGGTIVPELVPGSTSASVDVFNVTSQKWTSHSSMNDEGPWLSRAKHSCAVVSPGRVLVAGGVDEAGVVLSSVGVFDVANGTWHQMPDMIEARSAFGLTMFGDNRIIVVGGMGADKNALDTIEELSEDGTHWTPINLKLNVRRSQFSMSKVPKDYVHIC